MERRTIPPESRNRRARNPAGYARKTLTRAPRSAIVAAIAVGVIVCVAMPAPSQEYRVYGTITAELLHTWSEAEPSNRLAAPLSTSLAHSIAGSAFDLSARTVLATSPSGPYTAQITVPQLSLSIYPATWLTARVGRFDLDWGTTYVFTPGNDLALAGVTQLMTGLTGDAAGAAGSVSGASVSLTPGNTTTIALAGSLPTPLGTTSADPWREVTLSASADGLFGGLEWFLGFQFRAESVLRPSLGLSLDVAGTIVAGELAVELAERYRYPNEALAFEPLDEAAPVAALALQRTLSGNDLSINATVEYLFTGLGYSEAEADRFYDLLAAGIGNDIAPLGRHYVAAQISLSWFNAADLSAGGLVNVSDGSFAAGGELSIVALDAVDVYIRSGVVWGESRRSEFGLLGTATGTAIGVRLNL